MVAKSKVDRGIIARDYNSRELEIRSCPVAQSYVATLPNSEETKHSHSGLSLTGQKISILCRLLRRATNPFLLHPTFEGALYLWRKAALPA
jgi:hypothetical protein